MNWLKKEAGWEEIFWLIILFLGIGYGYSIGTVLLLERLGFDVPPVAAASSLRGMEVFSIWFVALLAGMALFEEILFRFPLSVSVAATSILKLPSVLVIVFALVLSAIFGWAHGSIYHVFIQGGTGFGWSMLYLKCGGFQGKPFKGLAVTTTTHFLFNAIAISLYALISGTTTF